RPMLTLAAVLAVLLAASGMLGCSTANSSANASAATPTTPTATLRMASNDAPRHADFEKDRAAILGMAGEFDVTFDFEETLAVRDGYELQAPYLERASEKVVVVEDTGEFISMQHLLVVKHGDKTHVIKHWRQDWAYQGGAGYDFVGDNVWEPIAYEPTQTRGAWIQSVYQVDDSPRYWGVGRWEHRDGLSTWTAATNRPLPRREFSKRKDYQVLGAVNTHVVTPTGWLHYQHNHKIDKTHPTQPVIAMEKGVNTYAKTTGTDFSAADEYWAKTAPYWKEVRSVWSEVYEQRETLSLKSRWKGDKMYTHLFDLADLYWGQADASEARAKIDEVIRAFRETDRVAQP
ncbi:MAG: DUF6607 family protein, partial [Phycisphaeraceae bacterium]